MAVGSGKRTDKGYVSIPLKVGDTVVFTRFAGTAMEEENVLLLREDEILGIVAL